MPRRPRFVVALVAAVALVGVAGCGDSPPSGSSAAERPPLTSADGSPASTATTPVATTTTPPTTPTTPTTTTTAPAQSGGASDAPPPATGGAPAGCGSAVGGFVREVRVSGTGCGQGRAVAEAWFAAVHDGAAPDGQIVAAGYRCEGTLAGERASVRCTASDGGTVAFTASP